MRQAVAVEQLADGCGHGGLKLLLGFTDLGKIVGTLRVKKHTRLRVERI